MKEKQFDIITILGPTASGKTSLAVAVATALKSHIISADSRQVYKKMDIGTGKDLNEYTLNGYNVPYHLIDTQEPGSKYNVFEYQRDFLIVYDQLKKKHILPIVCGGSGLYLESVLKGYRLLPVPENISLREQLKNKSIDELKTILSNYKELHNSTDIDTAKRAIRAIEIEEFYLHTAVDERSFPALRSLTVGVNVSRDLRRQRISNRLRTRLEEGMIAEVQSLLDSGIPSEDLIYYGLEYKYVTLYLTKKISYDEMVKQLEIAIHQFAKRQMTWFRGMEKRGTHIFWLPENSTIEENTALIIDKLNN